MELQEAHHSFQVRLKYTDRSMPTYARVDHARIYVLVQLRIYRVIAEVLITPHQMQLIIL